MYAFIGHVLTLDMALTFFLSASVFAFVLAQADRPYSDPDPDAHPEAKRRWMLVAWSAAALAVLTKGLVGIVLPVAAVALYVLIQRDWKLLARLHLAAGGLLLLLITAPWFIALWSDVCVAMNWFGHEKYCNPFQSFLIAPSPALKQARST